ncbi:MAG: cytochrome P450 [Chloroflexi bacterium]|nr:cytochrome P450 [Chloroflexota bacterium]
MSDATETTQKTPDDFNFLDPEVQDCPYEAYQVLRDQAPVYQDPQTGQYVITRFEDLREVLLDTENFGNGGNRAAQEEARPQLTERQKRMLAVYEENDGWLPEPTLAARDDPNHRQMRNMFDKAFRPGKIKQLDPFVESVANRLFDAFADDGHCDWVQQFSVPLPLIVIGHQMGVKEEDIWLIKRATDAWVRRFGQMVSEEEEREALEQEIAAQHYFKKVFDRLREEPDDTLLSDLVNTEIPEWGRTLTDGELQSEMMSDTFVGGSETSTNAIGEGVKILIEQPETWEQLKSDPDQYLRTFVEEVLRLESPVQMLGRVALNDVEMHGVTIPAGASIGTRYAAANRDERRFECPADVDLERKNPMAHLTFGAGIHYCLGAPLARRELYYSFKTLVDRVDEMWFAPEKNDFKHHPHMFLRALKELHIEFKLK